MKLRETGNRQEKDDFNLHHQKRYVFSQSEKKIYILDVLVGARIVGRLSRWNQTIRHTFTMSSSLHRKSNPNRNIYKVKHELARLYSLDSEQLDLRFRPNLEN